jgi:serine/threonine protein kinase
MLPVSLCDAIALQCKGVVLSLDATAYVSSRNLVVQAQQDGVSVALKLSLPEAKKDFENEVAILALLSNVEVPSVVSVWRLDCGVAAFTTPWYTRTLMDVINDGQLTCHGAWKVVHTVASVYRAAHALGVTHCDLKPENIYMLDGNASNCVVADWDLACNNKQTELVKLTVGTPSFNAPAAFAVSCVSVEADVFRLGTVMYAMLFADVPRWHWAFKDKLLYRVRCVEPPKMFEDTGYDFVMLSLLQQTGTDLSLETVHAKSTSKIEF